MVENKVFVIKLAKMPMLILLANMARTLQGYMILSA